jgi:hypothetical protein
MKFSNNFLILDVSKDTAKFMVANPVRSTIYVTGLTTAVTLFKTNPTLNDFMDQLRSAQNSVSLVYSDGQNPNTVKYLRFIEKSKNNDTLRYTSFYLFSILWNHDYPKSLSTAEAQCKYLQPELSTFHTRIVDFGIFGKWRNIEKQMIDYDINVDEK